MVGKTNLELFDGEIGQICEIISIQSDELRGLLFFSSHGMQIIVHAPSSNALTTRRLQRRNHVRLAHVNEIQVPRKILQCGRRVISVQSDAKIASRQSGKCFG